MILIVASLIAIIAVLWLFYEFWFLRDPERAIPAGNNIISPADGKVIKILPYDNTKVLIKKGFAGQIKVFTQDVAKEGWIISIFMSPLDVHVNRTPIEGKVKYVKHFQGKFRLAKFFDACIENERTEILVVNKKIKVKVVQIAGFLARRIVTFARPGEWVKKGQRIGLIKLGSQCCLVLPSNVKVLVKDGQRVKAGSSIIANIK